MNYRDLIQAGRRARGAGALDISDVFNPERDVDDVADQLDDVADDGRLRVEDLPAEREIGEGSVAYLIEPYRQSTVYVRQGPGWKAENGGAFTRVGSTTSLVRNAAVERIDVVPPPLEIIEETPPEDGEEEPPPIQDPEPEPDPEPPTTYEEESGQYQTMDTHDPVNGSAAPTKKSLALPIAVAVAVPVIGVGAWFLFAGKKKRK